MLPAASAAVHARPAGRDVVTFSVSGNALIHWLFNGERVEMMEIGTTGHRR
jgi:hypothetical protein